MPLLLDTPETIQGQQYAYIRAHKIVIDSKAPTLRFTVELGNVVDGKWVPAAMGHAQEATFLVRNVEEEIGNGINPATGEVESGVIVAADPQFNLLSANAVSSAAGQLAWDIVGDAIYQWLLDNNHYEGSIV